MQDTHTNTCTHTPGSADTGIHHILWNLISPQDGTAAEPRMYTCTRAHMCTITHSSGKQQKISWSKLVHLQTGMSQGTSDLSVAACGRKSGSNHCLMCPKSICREQRKQVLWCMYVCILFFLTVQIKQAANHRHHSVHQCFGKGIIWFQLSVLRYTLGSAHT